MKTNRMFGILCILLEKEMITAKELADYFEVSPRTIHRDLLDLSGAGFPVTSKQGIGGGVSLLPDFRYNKSALNQEDVEIMAAGIQGFASIEDSAKIKTLLAKLRFSQGGQLPLEHDIIIDFTSWNHRSDIIEKIKVIRWGIAGHRLLEMEYYGGSGNGHRVVEPYKLIFKQESWYLFAYCKEKEDFRVFKLNRMTGLRICEETFEERAGYRIPDLISDFANDSGQKILVRMDGSLEYLAVDFFGSDHIRKEGDSIYAAFLTEQTDWVISTFAGFGDKAEILEPDFLREEMRLFLRAAQKLYES